MEAFPAHPSLLVWINIVIVKALSAHFGLCNSLHFKCYNRITSLLPPSIDLDAIGQLRDFFYEPMNNINLKKILTCMDATGNPLKCNDYINWYLKKPS